LVAQGNSLGAIGGNGSANLWSYSKAGGVGKERCGVPVLSHAKQTHIQALGKLLGVIYASIPKG